MRSSRELFTTVRSEGAILPGDLLQRIAGNDGDLSGLKPSDYHLLPSERLNEAINRAWNRLLGAWATFEAARERLPESDAGTTATRERWLLPLFQELGYGRLQQARALELEGKSYPISHGWGHVPIHLVSFRVDLDKKTPGVAGAARMSPHGMLQEALNRSGDHLWGIVANGLRLRLLRDNASLGTGFLKHPANGDLRRRLRVGELDKQEYYRQLLRTVYRLLFLFVAEDRELLLRPDASV